MFGRQALLQAVVWAVALAARSRARGLHTGSHGELLM